MTPFMSLRRVVQTGSFLLACCLLAWGSAALAEDRLQELRDARLEERLQYHILAAELAGQRGQLRFAAQEYLNALELLPDAALAERATRVALYAEADDLALAAARIWTSQAPERYEARFLLVRLALRAGEEALALAESRALLEDYPQGQEAAFRDLARSLAGDGGNQLAARRLMEALVVDHPQSAAGRYALGLLALQENDARGAEMAANAALALASDWDDALLLKLTALLRQGRVDEADALITSLEGEDERLAHLHLAYARLLLEAEQSDAAIRQFQAALEYESEQPEALYALALLHLNVEDHEAAYPHLIDLYDLETPRQSEVAYYLGGIEEMRGDYEEALEWYRRVQEGGHVMDAAQRKAFALARLERMDEARALLADLRARHEESAVRFYLVEAELLFQMRAYLAASELYSQALKEYPDEPDLLYGRSLVSERLGRITLAERDLRRILEIAPDDARSLNALGYILSNHSKRYDEALELISRALAQTPDDATVIDSMGWIQYRLGDLDAALGYLSQAFDKMPDPEVAAHLGEVLWKLGQRDRAQNIWRDALAEDPEHPVLQETIDRLTQ